MNVIYAPRAIRDLESIASYLGERSPSGAVNVLSAIRSRIDVLPFYPHIAPPLDDAEHRRLSVVRYPYVIFYRIFRRRDLDPAYSSHLATTARFHQRTLVSNDREELKT
jgi:toxin ParE1/3/4